MMMIKDKIKAALVLSKLKGGTNDSPIRARHIEIATLPTTSENEYLDCSISFVKGQGYFLSVSPVKVKDEGHYKVTSYDGWAGYKMNVLIANRYSAKRLAELANYKDNDKLVYMIERVLQDGKLQLA